MQLLYQDTSLVSEKEIVERGKLLDSYLVRLLDVSQTKDYSSEESFINLPFDEEMVSEVLRFQKMASPSDLKYLFVIGIGGSSLGTKAVYDALPNFSSLRVIFLDTFQKIPEIVAEPAEVLINVISKSGTTMETEFNLKNLLKKYPEYSKRIFYTTSQTRSGEYLKIPEKVGGRFSVFSPVGLFPLSLMGINIMHFMEGGMEARRDCLNTDIFKNPAMLLATITFLLYRKERDINVSFYFHPQLESLGKWNSQLMAESLGKDGKGLTPLLSVATNDLHSMLQLYLEGSQDKFTEFVYGSAEFSPEMKAILEGVKNSYNVRDIPYISLNLDHLTAKSLGYYMQFKMMEILFLGALQNESPFGQPAVEEYKKFARDLLGNKS